MQKKRRFGMKNVIAGVLTAALVLTSTPSGILAGELLEVETEEMEGISPVEELAETAPAEGAEDALSLFGEDDADEAMFSVSEDVEAVEAVTESDVADDEDATETVTEAAAESITDEVTETVTEAETEAETYAEDEAEVDEAEVVEAAEVETNSATVEGIRGWYYTYFTAALTGANVTVAVPSFLGTSVAYMQASYVEAAEYEELINADNYGKVVEDLKAIEITFFDKKGKAVKAGSVGAEVELASTGADTYVMYQQGKTSMKKAASSDVPYFSFTIKNGGIYVFAGLAADGVDRAAGVTSRGITTFDLTAADGTSIEVSAPKAAFSGTTYLEAAEADTVYVMDKASDALEDNEALSDVVKAFDLSFHSEAGMEIEPASDVTVTIEATLDANGSYRLIHIKDDGTTEVLGEDQVSFRETGVTFTADEFSTYVIAETVTTVDYLTADGKTVKITVAFDERENVPAGAVLEVEEVLDDEEERAVRNERLAHVLFEEYGNVLMSDVRYLNISILVNGEEYQPEFPVQVKAEYSEILNTADPQEYVFTEEFTPEDVEEHVNHFVAVHYTDDGAEILGSKESYSDAGLTETVITTQGFSDYDLAYIYEYETIEQKYDYRASSISEILAAADMPLVKAAAVGDVPDHEKTLEDNHDGTYTIGLSVTGDADTDNNTASNANVIIVFDTSNSMINYYVPMANGARGSNNDDGSNSFVLYRNTNGTEADDGYTGTVYSRTRYGNNWSYSEYTGQRYSKTIRRADAAEKVLYDFAHALYGYQNEDDPSTDEDESKNIQAALITFNQGATTVQSWTSTETDITNRVSSTGAGGSKKLGNSSGTNWQAALQQAQGLIGTDDSENDPTFVVFITDGQPTQWVGHTSGYDTTSAGYEHSRDEARAIQVACAATGTDSHGALFGIYAYGTEADYLDELMYYAYTGTARTADPGTVSTEGYYNAGDSEALAAAINDIFQKIVKTLGIGAATITDGTTSDVHTTSGDIADLLEVNEDSYQYWLTVPASKTSDTTYTFEMKDLLSGNSVAYTATVSGGNVKITWTIDGSSKIATYPGYVETEAGGSKITLEWTTGTNFYSFAPPAATFTDPSVSWDLKGLGTLLDGVEYKVTFEVYPSQYTLDLIADLKNNFVTYDSLDANVKKYLLKDGDNYTLLTNTEATLKYTDSRTTAGEQSSVYDNPDPVNTVAAEQIAVAKEWINNLEGDDRYKPAEMTLKVTRDLVNRYNVTLNDSNHWTNNVYISFGLMTVDDSGNVTLKTTGHNYSFAELPAQEYYWELQTQVVRPMLVNNVQQLLVMIDEAKGETVPDDLKSIAAANGTVAVSGITYYKLTIDGKVMYYKVVDAHTTLHATNFRRSYLEVHKEITGSLVPDDATFDFDITVKNSKAAKGSADNTDSDYYVWFSIFDTDAGAILKDDSIVTASGATVGKEMKNGQWTGYFYVPSETPITVKMKTNYSLRFLNLPEDSTYSISETLSQDYQCVSVDGTRGYLAPAEDEGEAGTWTTESTGTVDLTVPSITGTIEYANSEYKVVVTNKCIGAFYVYHSSDNSIEKIYASDSRLGTDGKFNIVKETKDSFLYGGYYKGYSGAVLTDEQIKNLTYDKNTAGVDTEYDGKHVDGFWNKDDAGKPYSYENIQNIVNADADKVSWNWTDAYQDVSGDAITPTVNTVYYLKEVPDNYLTNYIYAIYQRDTRVMETLYEMTALDDLNYLGYALDGTYAAPGTTAPSSEVLSGGKLVKGIKFKSFVHENEDNKVYGEWKTTSNSYNTAQSGNTEYQMENVFDPEGIKEGYLAYWKWAIGSQSYPITFCPVWQTPDKVYVHGNFTGTLTVPAGNRVDDITLSKVSK